MCSMFERHPQSAESEPWSRSCPRGIQQSRPVRRSRPMRMELDCVDRARSAGRWAESGRLAAAAKVNPWLLPGTLHGGAALGPGDRRRQRRRCNAPLTRVSAFWTPGLRYLRAPARRCRRGSRAAPRRPATRCRSRRPAPIHHGQAPNLMFFHQPAALIERRVRLYGDHPGRHAGFDGRVRWMRPFGHGAQDDVDGRSRRRPAGGFPAFRDHGNLAAVVRAHQSRHFTE
jgi:hypothetical protein